MKSDTDRQKYSNTLEDVLEIIEVVKKILKMFLNKKCTFRDLRQLFKIIRNVNNEAVNYGETEWIVDSLREQFHKKL